MNISSHPFQREQIWVNRGRVSELYIYIHSNSHVPTVYWSYTAIWGMVWEHTPKGTREGSSRLVSG